LRSKQIKWVIIVEVAFEPYKKISFQSYLPFESLEEFTSFIACGIPPNALAQTSLFWANGILFRFFNHPPTESVVKENLNGHIIFDHIEFAPMPEYKNELKVSTRPLASIIVLDVSKHVVFNPLTAWIRDNLLKTK
jgi:hypothetical protein